VIVISGALVVVALVLLVLGVTGPELDLVYGSIAVSLLSLVFLVLGIIQRRGEVLPTGAAAEPERDVRDRARGDVQDGSVHHGSVHHGEVRDGDLHDGDRHDDDRHDDDRHDGDLHDGDRHDGDLHDSDGPAQPVGGTGGAPGAVELGPVPVEQSSGGSVAAVSEEPARAGSALLPAADEDSSGTVLVVVNRPRYHVAGCRYLAGKTPESRDVSDAVAQGFTPCGVCKPDAVLRGAAASPDALFPADPEPIPPTRAARVAGPRPAPVARTPAEQVVVIADRNRYHRADCRHVRGLPGAETLDPAAAVRQGYGPCGVCKP